jgi:hypothetical protein
VALTSTESWQDRADGEAREDDQRYFEPERLGPGLTVHHVREGDELWDPAERFVYRVFRTSEFCRESPREWVEETEPWRAGSSLHVVTEDDGRIMGVCRTILGEYDDLPVAQFRPEIPVRAGQLCEIGSLAVRPSSRGIGVANELHRVAFQAGIVAGAVGFCFLVDRWMFDFFASHYGLPVRQLAPSRRYMGGDVVPTAMWMPEMLERIAVIRPRVYKWSVEGLPARLWEELDLPIVLD